MLPSAVWAVWALFSNSNQDSLTLQAQLPHADLIGSPPDLLASILANFNVPGGLPGLSIASPSTSNPNYYFHWVRDGALNVDALVNAYRRDPNPQLLRTIEDYLASSRKLQAVPNLSGGVGEPKFHVDGSAFNARWGRPQNDGPALRAMVMAKWLQTQPDEDVKQSYAQLYTDLDYVARVWALPSFDLWEEVYGYHFFTSCCHYGAMKAGALMAWIAGQDNDVERFTRISEQIVNFIEANYLGSEHIQEHFPSQGRGGLDVASVLAVLELDSLAGWTVDLDGKELALGVDHPLVRASAEALANDMAARYPINNGQPGGIGRYPEDVYDGYGTSEGNPWFIATAGVADLLCRNGNKAKAKAHLDFIKAHRGTSLSEQMDRASGYMVGAANLTWSYCSVLRAFEVCEEVW